jgi:hypothetical protein
MIRYHCLSLGQPEDQHMPSHHTDGKRWRALADYLIKYMASGSNCWLRLWMEYHIAYNACTHGSALWGKVL